jgi:cysteine desulfurase family protein (TIGR01976 family)
MPDLAPSLALDVSLARSFFPALSDDWALMDNAGGSVPPRTVIDRVAHYLSTYAVQLGASYAKSSEAGERVREGIAAAARLVGADPAEIVLGPSTSMNALTLSRALAPTLAAGDRVIVTNLDHEANIGAWWRLEERGVEVVEWRFRPESMRLELEDLDALLTDRTRLVTFTQCANVVGAIHDAAAIARRVHEAGAQVCVDGVAYAPHRRVDVKALDADYYLLSLYKTYGPHLGLLYGKQEHLDRLASQNHFFLADEPAAYRLEPGNVNHELTAALPGIVEYLEALAARPAGAASGGDPLSEVFDRIAAHEERLAAPILALLRSKPGVRILGPSQADRAARVPTIAFTVAGRKASEIPPLLDGRRLAVRWGHFYAYRAMRALGLLEFDGVVRVSLVHYNTLDEVARLVTALDEIL